MNARLRSLTVVALIAAGALGLIGSTQTWIVAVLADDALAVPGGTAVPVLQPLMLTVLALGLVLTLVGRVLRYVFGALAVVLGACVAVLVTPLLVAPPISAVAPVVTEKTGITGHAAVGELVVAMNVTPWVPVTLAVAVLIIAAGIAVLLTAHRWVRGGRRYATEAARPRDESAPLDAVDSWDDLSRGDDPTD